MGTRFWAYAPAAAGAAALCLLTLAACDGAPSANPARAHLGDSQENADYHFKRDGDAVGATSEDDFLTKVHAFVDHPPEGVETLTRSNGDKLMYDAKANLFAVVDKDGAPRTLFKPRDGATYWRQQKDSLASGDDSYRSSGSKSAKRSARRSSSDDNG